MNSIKYFGTFIFSIFLVSFNLQAQYIDQLEVNEGNANKMFDISNYQESIRQFESLLKKDSSNLDYKLKAGIAYSHSFINTERGLELLKQAFAKDHKIKGLKEALAYAYFVNYQFDKASEFYMELKEKASAAEQKKKFQDWIDQVARSKKIYEQPIAVHFENLGKNVNSPAPDYRPYVEPDESNLLFTTRRKDVSGRLYDFGGYHPADIFSAAHKRNKYRRAHSIGNPNTYGNEETAGISDDGKYMIYHVNSGDHFSDLFVSEKGRRSYMPPFELGAEEVNSKKSRENGGSICRDGNRFYFSSDRDGGLGGFDIYYINRLPNGNWGLPINLGAPINTPKDEEYPLIRDNEATLYFSSNGHPGMGGMDIFKATMNNATSHWENIEALPYPINTTQDDWSISFAENPTYAYVAQKREDSFGDLDIYRITFLDKKPNYTLVSGEVRGIDSTKIADNILSEINIEIFDNNDILIGNYRVNSNTRKYHAILTAGSYRIEIIDLPNYENYEMNFQLFDKNDFVRLLKKDIFLQPK